MTRQVLKKSRSTSLARVSLLVVLAVALLSGSVLAASSETVDEELAPDVILVMIDDHAYISDERVLERLPQIKELFLDAGLRFNEMYDETPLCCPARATMLSGQHTLRHGVTGNRVGELDTSNTIATTMSDAGYSTFMAGKYTTGPKPDRTPPGWDRVMMSKNKRDPSFFIDGEFVRFDGGFVDDAIREGAVQFLEEAPLEQPVYAHITPVAPHRVTCVGEGKSDETRSCDYLPAVMEQDVGSPLCSDIPDYRPPDYEILPSQQGPPWAMPDWPDGWPLTTICESLLVVDRMVGELRDAQAERDRPVRFVFLSDNGMSWGRKSFPLKHVPTATRLPFYVAGTGIEPGDDATLLSNIDLAPTLAAMGGTAIPRADGVSFLPIIEGEAFEGRAEVLEIMPSNEKRSYDGWAALRTPEWRFIRWDDGRAELYDLVADPDELVSIAAEQPDRVNEMSSRLDILIEESRGPTPSS